LQYTQLLHTAGIELFPLFGDQLSGEPHRFDLSVENPKTATYPTHDFDAFQEEIFSELEQSGATWGTAAYLENRAAILSQFPQMVEEERFYHLGLDVIVPAGFILHAPLTSRVYDAGLDGGAGNYGGYVILEHQVNDSLFYSFYGHLDTQALPEPGRHFSPGEPFAVIGKEADSGGWFTHVHLQMLTPKAIEAGMTLKGYATADFLPQVEAYFPDPTPFFRY
jgi:murein DD-endopeptidase MepM/ murein hydrolase activator NlpD